MKKVMRNIKEKLVSVRKSYVHISDCYTSLHEMLQEKCEIIEKKTLQGASDGRYVVVFTLKRCMSRGRSLSGNRGLG